MTENLLLTAVAAPAVLTGLLGFGWLLGWSPAERTVGRLTAWCYLLSLASLVGVWTGLVGQGGSVHLDLGNWFQVEHHRFNLSLVADALSLPLMGLSVVLLATIAAFSQRYLHRDAGFLRFFFLLNLFGFGVLLLFSAGSLDLLIGGWEMVGLTSVFLIAFFQYRDGPVLNGVRVFATYRACDIGLLTAAVMLHRYSQSATFSELFRADWPAGVALLNPRECTVVGLLLLLAAMGKAAQVPFSGWLPRAMEGPTPSSAVFYGALSVHAGAYLMLRVQPLLSKSPLASACVVVVGLLTAIHGTMAGRVAADAKTSLAHASLTQLGLIFMEIGLGWHGLALLHICGHAAVRTLEFLRAPSMLHDFHHVHAAAGGQLGKTGNHYELLLPAKLRLWLYRLALDRSHVDTLVERFAVRPVLRMAEAAHQLEEAWLARVTGRTRPAAEPIAQLAGVASPDRCIEHRHA